MRVLEKLLPSVAVALALVAATPAYAASSCPVTPSLAAGKIPDDVCVKQFEAFSNMAWQTFKMLVWPASGRGVADRARKITDMQGPRVFETFKSNWETFLPNSSRPLPWGEYPTQAHVCSNAATLPPLPHNRLVLSALSKFGSFTPQELADPGNAAIAQLMLVAQNGSPGRFLVSFDEKAFNHIRTHELYGPIAPPSEDAPKGKRKAADGSITLKSVWIEVLNNKPDPAKFFTADALVQEFGKTECKPARVALVGLHIAHKTPSSPQWIWASFEHADNAPLLGAPPRNEGYTFNNGTGTPMPRRPPEPKRTSADAFAPPEPFNVERLRPIADVNVATNDRWRTLLRNAGSVWANYQLVAVEWPALSGDPNRNGLGFDDPGAKKFGARPTPPCRDAANSNVANTVIETFLQDRVDCLQPTTCMSCHNSARNYDFIWSIPLKDNDAPAAAHPEVRRSALSVLRAIVGFGPRQ